MLDVGPLLFRIVGPGRKEIIEKGADNRLLDLVGEFAESPEQIAPVGDDAPRGHDKTAPCFIGARTA